MKAPNHPRISRLPPRLAATQLLLLSHVLLAGVIFAQPVVVADTDAAQQAEIESLRDDLDRLESRSSWVPNAVAVLSGAIGAAALIWIERFRRRGAVDQAVHERRIFWYPRLVRATAGLAVYFPGRGRSVGATLTPDSCAEMGRSMSRWYFLGGGLLMSTQARDAYFDLARGLTLAAAQDYLRVPQTPADAVLISKELLANYRSSYTDELKSEVLDEWEFAADSNNEERSAEPQERFKDFVWLQELGSRLRTSLAKDLRSRRVPA